MRIAICDDDPQELSHLMDLLVSYQSVRPGLRLEITTHSGGENLLAAATKRPFDLYLLDILMSGITGIELAARLSRRQHDPLIIFLTSSMDYAVDAFRVRANNYLLKPLTATPLYAALDEVIARAADPRDTPITFATVENSHVTVPISSIVYTECVIHTVRYHMADGTVFSGRTIRVPFARAIEDLLNTGYFIQPHRSFAVNMEYIVRLTDQSIALSTGASLPISRLRLGDSRTAYEDFLQHRLVKV